MRKWTHWFLFDTHDFYYLSCSDVDQPRLLFCFVSFSDARFFDLSSTYYSGKNRQSAAARFWHFWYNTTTLYSYDIPYNGNLFKKTNKPRPNPTRRPRPPPPTPPPIPPPRPTPSLEVTPTVGVYFRTDSQFSVEQSVATQVYDKTGYGMNTNNKLNHFF